MRAVPAEAPSLRVETVQAPDKENSKSRLDGDQADVRLMAGGRLRMRRGEGRARFSFAAPPAPSDLLHPYLAPAAALAHLWAGREAFHAGSFATRAGAVVVLADKGGGKSTTLAWLAAEHAVPVLSDDLVIVEDGLALAGPRCLDLRAQPAVRCLALADSQPVRGTDRLRMTLAPGPAQAPLAGTVVLQWGSRLTMTAVRIPDRVRRLLPYRMFADRLAVAPNSILELCAVPMLILTRPHGERGLREAAKALADYFG